MTESAFHPSASLNDLKKRARLLTELRAFFYARDVMEVDTPILCRAAVTDVYIESLKLDSGEQPYLQTSPEFYMKRLLAAGSGSIYYLGKAFRREESGRFHRNEFTMLEWYRVGFSDDDLMTELSDLILALSPGSLVQRFSYGELFQKYVGINPYCVSVSELQACASRQLNIDWADEDKTVWFDLLFTHLIEPKLKGCVIVDQYPAEMCALAKVAWNNDGFKVARRFELFWDGIELANGYWELTDAAEQERRFKADLAMRVALAKPTFAYDKCLLKALDEGLPECAGVALGVDRLLMCLLGHNDIAKVMPFANG